MRHTIQVEGFGVRLRPVRMEDAAFIVWLRHLAHVKGKVGDSAMDVATQQAWLEAYFERPGDYYFVVETLGGTPIGAYGLYDVVGASAESGRWIIRPEVLAAIPSAFHAFEIAFGRVGLDEVRVRTVSSNHAVLSLNRKLGFRQTSIEPAARVIGGQAVELVHFVLEAKVWLRMRERLLPLARLAERQVQDWEQAHLKIAS